MAGRRRHHLVVRRSRVLLSGSWVVATAVATLISAAGVSIVTRDVTNDHSPSLGAADVVALLGPGAKIAASPIPTGAPSEVPLPTSTVSPPVAPPAPSPSSSPSPPPVSSTPPTVTALEVPASSTFARAGGVIAVGCAGDDVTLLSARPNNGYQVKVHDTGPRRVVVSFAPPEGKPERVVAACAGGIPTLLDRAAAATPAQGREGDDDNDDSDGNDERERSGGNGGGRGRSGDSRSDDERRDR